jgi:hypothetical protein
MDFHTYESNRLAFDVRGSIVDMLRSGTGEIQSSLSQKAFRVRSGRLHRASLVKSEHVGGNLKGILTFKITHIPIDNNRVSTYQIQKIEKHTCTALLSRISLKLVVKANTKLTWINPWVGEEHRKVPRTMLSPLLGLEGQNSHTLY